MLGICGEVLSGEMGVSSNSVTGVSGTGTDFLGFSSERPFFILRLETIDRVDARLSRPDGSIP